MEEIIKINNLRKIYQMGNEKVIALNGISTTIHKGEICSIFGTSGSGKSTLLNQLSGMEKPTQGNIFIGKTDITKLKEEQITLFRQKYVGFIFQAYNLLPNMTALENVSVPLMFRGIGKRKREEIAIDFLKRVGLEKRMHHFPSQMSGGQQQRVGIARAFASYPQIIFADEPTGNLDTATTAQVMEMIVEMAQKNKQTIILVTHDPAMTSYADHIISLIDGNIVKDERTTNNHRKGSA